MYLWHFCIVYPIVHILKNILIVLIFCIDVLTRVQYKCNKKTFLLKQIVALSDVVRLPNRLILDLLGLIIFRYTIEATDFVLHNIINYYWSKHWLLTHSVGGKPDIIFIKYIWIKCTCCDKTKGASFVLEHTRITSFMPTGVHQFPFTTFVKRHPAAK